MLKLHSNDHAKHGYRWQPFGQNQGYMGGLGSGNEIGFQGHEEANNFGNTCSNKWDRLEGENKFSSGQVANFLGFSSNLF